MVRRRRPSWGLMKSNDDGSSEQANQAWQADARLAQAAGKGDAAAQRDLLARAMPFVMQAVRPLLAMPQHREDVVQASLLAILQSAMRFEGRSSLGTWVTRIAMRTALRHTHKERALVPCDVVEPTLVGSHEQRSLEELPRRVADYLSCLPADQGQALLLRYCLDYTVDEIAEATDASRNTVKYRLKEALSTFRRRVRRDLARGGKRHDL